MSRPIRAAGTRPNFDSTENRPANCGIAMERRAEIHAPRRFVQWGAGSVMAMKWLCSGSVRCGIAQHTKKSGPEGYLARVWCRFGTDQEICSPGDRRVRPRGSGRDPLNPEPSGAANPAR